MYNLSSFYFVPFLKNLGVVALCRPACTNGGKCLESGVCKCPPTYSGRWCQLRGRRHRQQHGDWPQAGDQGRRPWWSWHPPVSSNEVDRDWGAAGTELALSNREEEVEAAAVAPACRRRCRNGGVCGRGNRCRCPGGFRGRYCHKRKIVSIDPLLLLRVVHWQLFFFFLSLFLSYRTRAAKCPGGCKNGGTCVAPNNCRCALGFEGRNCKEGAN